MLCFCEELTQILFHLESLMTHIGDPGSRYVSVRLPDNQRVGIIISVKESTALVTFR